MYAATVQARVTRGGRRGPPIDGWARNSRKKPSAVGGMVAAGHSASHWASGLAVAMAMKLQRCQADTMKVKAANEV